MFFGILAPLFLRERGVDASSRHASHTDVGNQVLLYGDLSMAQSIDSTPVELDVENTSTAQFVHSALRFLLAVRYRKNLVIAVLAAAALLGGLYYATAPRRYSSKAGLLVTQTGQDHFDTSITNEQSQRDNALATFENLVRSDKVVEGALKYLAAGDAAELANLPPDRQVARPEIELDRQGDTLPPAFWK